MDENSENHRFGDEAFRALFEAAPDALVILNFSGAIRMINSRTEELLGFGREELVDQPVEVLVPGRFRETHLGFRADYLDAPHVRPMSDSPDLYALAKDGNEIPVEISLSPATLGGETFVIGAIRDISQRKQAEEERHKLDARVQQTQKLETLGLLAGGIAHDFNNMLVAVLGNTDLALSRLSPTAPAIDDLKEIVIAAERAAGLCRELLAYSGRGQFEIQAVDLSQVVEEMTHLVEISIAKKIVVNYDFASELPATEVDVTQVRQVVMNLVTNASEAIGDASGSIRIATGGMHCSTEYLAGIYLAEDLPEGFYVYLEVSDTGVGMDEETKQRIFDPFFSTKRSGRGLGLAAVLGIIRGHRGALKVYSEPGRGTTFKVVFPATSLPAHTGIDESRASDQFRGRGTILLADDEESVRALARKMLESIGFDVLTAADGREAVEILREHYQEIVAVLLDLNMPRRRGEEAFRDMTLIDPDVRVILMSGYSQQEVTSRFSGKGLAGFLAKPFRIGDLAGVLQAALQR